jgi:hypothetical protein
VVRTLRYEASDLPEVSWLTTLGNLATVAGTERMRTG